MGLQFHHSKKRNDRDVTWTGQATTDSPIRRPCSLSLNVSKISNYHWNYVVIASAQQLHNVPIMYMLIWYTHSKAADHVTHTHPYLQVTTCISSVPIRALGITQESYAVKVPIMNKQRLRNNESYHWWQCNIYKCVMRLCS